eukprot:CAMPEP_0117554726 /NCGR_PEP_ID=MMETSP0784-20121206/50904_1 /TAXON_ID=39447 /ORGANISM="" /LENGTH=91 /DNA_ID=CAMNT_0005351903 /DNA_START=555 /DNA_END=831 /DNA_ORIENTATION=-
MAARECQEREEADSLRRETLFDDFGKRSGSLNSGSSGSADPSGSRSRGAFSLDGFVSCWLAKTCGHAESRTWKPELYAGTRKAQGIAVNRA